MEIFLLPSLLLTLISWLSVIRRSFLFLFVHLLIVPWYRGFLFFQEVCYCYPPSGPGSPFRMARVSRAPVLILFPSGSARYSRLILFFHASALESAVSVRSPDSFESRVVFRTQGLGSKGAHCSRPVTDSRPSQRGCCLVSQSCLTLCDPMDCSPPGCSVHGISQTRTWTEPASPVLAGGFFTAEPPGKLLLFCPTSKWWVPKALPLFSPV